MKERHSMILNSDLFDSAFKVVDDLGLEMDDAINMFLKRVTKEGSLSFLFESSAISKIEDKPIENLQKSSNFMNKSKAIRLFESLGKKINGTVTYSSKNKTGDYYWANPNFSILKTEWNLILNNRIDRKLYLFTIPANKIKPTQLIARGDAGNENLVDLQIAFGDITFTDNRSRYSFRQFLKAEAEY